MLFLAFRNILRNKRRTLMTIVILGISFSIMMLINSYITTMYDILKKGSIEKTGHLQVRAVQSGDEPELISQDAAAAIAASLQGDARVKDVAQELDVNGMVGTETRSAVFNAVGVEYGKKGAASNLELRGGFSLIKDDYDKDSILLSQAIAAKLGVKAGDYVTVVVTTKNGVLNLNNAYVNGLVSTGQTDLDDYYAACPLRYAQSLFDTQGISRMMIYAKDEASMAPLTAKLEGLIKVRNLKLAVFDWKSLATYYFGLKNLYDFIFGFVIVIICVLVSLSVSEIIAIGLYERFREIGTMRSIGTKQNEIFLLLLNETLLYNLSGIAFGLAFGSAVAALVNRFGLTFVPPGQNMAVPFIFNISFEHMILPICLLLFISFGSTIFPIIRTTRLRVVEVIRHV